MMARIVSLDRDYARLNTVGGGTAPLADASDPRLRNKWNVVWESYVGVLFFAMDSSLECFTNALNALGYLLDPGGFIDITDHAKLKRITPTNLLDQPTAHSSKFSAYPACSGRFPKICDHWSVNRNLLAVIIEYHDATKHRHSVSVGQTPGYPYHVIKMDPKQPMKDVIFDPWTGHVAYDTEQSLQSITARYHNFIIEWLRIARQELESVFGLKLSDPEQIGARTP